MLYYKYSSLKPSERKQRIQRFYLRQLKMRRKHFCIVYRTYLFHLLQILIPLVTPQRKCYSYSYFILVIRSKINYFFDYLKWGRSGGV